VPHVERNALYVGLKGWRAAPSDDFSFPDQEKTLDGGSRHRFQPT
jgi:hypothetical protein